MNSTNQTSNSNSTKKTVKTTTNPSEYSRAHGTPVHFPGKIIFSIVLIAVLVFLDQLTKLLAVQALKGKPDIILIPRALQLTYLENRGAAFSFMANHSVFQSIMAVVTPIVLLLIVIFVVHSFFVKNERRFRALRLDLLFIFAGALGNYIDRMQNKYVVDFIYFSLINFPVFNVADIYVTIGVIVLFILIIARYSDKDLADFFNLKKL